MRFCISQKLRCYWSTPTPSLRREGVRFLAVLIYPDTCFLFSGSLHCVPTSHPSSSITCSLVCKAHIDCTTEPNVSSSFKEAFQSFGICMCNPSKKQAILLREGLKHPQEQTLSAPLCSPRLHSPVALCACVCLRTVTHGGPIRLPLSLCDCC